MKVFVTGADGFIGSHLCEALRDAGHEVTGLALYNSFDSFGWLDEVDGIKKVRGDIRDAEQMRRLIKGHDIVFHLAALISVPDSYERPRSYVETNVIGTLNILEAAREAGCKVVHTSTSEVYGTARYIPMDEKHPINPQSPYAASKIAADALVKSFHLTYGLPCVIIRPFNTFGPRQSERAVIPSIIRQALGPDIEEIRIGNGAASRDLMYVADTTAAFIAVSQLGFGVYNAGTGESGTIYDLAVDIRTMAGTLAGRKKKDIVTDTERLRPENSEVSMLCADASELMKATGWRPKWNLAQGLYETMSWAAKRVITGASYIV